MHISQSIFTVQNPTKFGAPKHGANQLVLIFGSSAMMADAANFNAVREAFPDGVIAGCSTAGEIHGTTVTDETLVVTVVDFEHTVIRHARTDIVDSAGSFTAGQTLAAALPPEELAHVLIFSDGLKVNGTELVRGLRGGLPRHVEVTGGLSGDGPNFHKTWVCANDVPMDGQIVAVGLYGQRIKIGYGSLGGWDPFGPEREITRSSENVLFDLDGKPALDLYKHYLGDQATGLPATALLFPLSLRYPDREGGAHKSNGGVVRTILGIDDVAKSMTFAGDMPQGGYVRLMKANFDRLIDGASGAARIGAEALQDKPAQLALLISCVGRKLVLKQRVEEEVEGVREVLGAGTVLSGFYSYGEISPHMEGAACELHNQTMTITTFRET